MEQYSEPSCNHVLQPQVLRKETHMYSTNSNLRYANKKSSLASPITLSPSVNPSKLTPHSPLQILSNPNNRPPKE